MVRGLQITGDARPLAALLFLGAAIGIGLLPLRPPAVVPADAPTDLFSAQRAFEHLRVIAQRPHPIDSPDNARVRQYLLDQLRHLGWNPHIETAPVHRQLWRGDFRGTVHNILARQAGSGGGGGGGGGGMGESSRPALMLACHYDSVPEGPGAADDGASVAAVLETLRALRQGPPLANDLIVLFTDGEEYGLLGSRVFVALDPWAIQVGAVLNFEARGTRGPVFMFETSRDNGWLIRQLIAAAPDPLASSISSAVYERMPNATDLTVFKKFGMPGLNFAMIGGIENYHTAHDDLAHLDLRSLQHHGSYMLALTRRLGNMPLAAAGDPGHPGGDAIYFNVLGHWMIAYPVAWAWPISGAVTALVLLTLGLGLSRQRLHWQGVGMGLASALLAVGGTTALIYVLRWDLSKLRDGLLLVPGSKALLHTTAYSLGLVTAGAGAFIAIYTAFLRRWPVRDLSAGAALLWAAALLAITRYASGGSYLLAWPLAAWALAALPATLESQRPRPLCTAALLEWSLPPLVAILLFTAITCSLYVAIPLIFMPLGIVAAIWPLTLCLGQVAALTRWRTWPATLLLLTATGIMTYASLAR